GGAFADVSAVIRHAWTNRSTLLAESQSVRRALEDSSLPAWLVTKVLNERFVANTNTILDRQGRFSVNEAPTGMSQCLGTLDQRTCSGGYWTMFYPSLDAVELEMFTHCQGPNGAPAHDLGNGEFNLTPRPFPWPDLAAAYVIQVHRHFLRTGDRGFLERHWPFVKSALEWAIGLDETGDAIPTLKPGRGTTYDNQQWDGISAFLATLHEAGLTLGADIAGRMGEAALATSWSHLAAQAAASRQKHLWVEAGGYLRNAFDPATGKADEGVFLSALAGDWAILAGGGDVHLDKALLHRAMESIIRKCLLGRGMTDQGGKNNTQSAFMQYPMAYFAGAALLLGRDDLAWTFMFFQDQVIICPPSTHFNQTLTYNPDGTAYGLPYYMTAPASWLCVDALAGVVPDVDRRRLTLGTSWLWGHSPQKTPVFLTTGWFSVESRREATGVTLTLTPIRSFSPFPVQTLAVRLGETLTVSEALVNGWPVAVRSAAGTVELPVDFDPGRQAATVKIMP
ncbi:MAG: GH116 family glycosyl hydrolase, partial [Planctomycetota bacterium]|nr:GH116 family glycosyl hydrolase [Planctomycetota bacterium]